MTRHPSEEIELIATTRLREELGPCLDFGVQVLALISYVRQTTPRIPITKRFEAMSSLLVRVSNDLRCIAILAQKGYSLQAAAIAAGTWETYHTLALIALNDKRLDEWYNHSDSRHCWRHSSKLTDWLPEDTAKDERDIYSRLCMAKHANPMMQKRLGVERLSDDLAVYYQGPEPKNEGLQLSWYSLQQASRCAFLSANRWVMTWMSILPKEGVPEFILKFQSLIEQYKQLRTAAISRWGTEDVDPTTWPDVLQL